MQTQDLLDNISEEEAANAQSIADAETAAPEAPVVDAELDLDAAVVDLDAPVIVDLETPVAETPVTDASPESETPVKTPTKAELKKAETAAKKAAKEAEKAAKEEAKAAEKAAKEAEKAAKEASKLAPKVLQPTQNGVRHPKAETNCGKVWALCNELSAEKGAVINCKELVENQKTIDANIHPKTVSSEFYMWKRFHFGSAKSAQAVAETTPVEETLA